MKSASSTYPRIVVTMGEASGIGPELLVKIAQKQFDAEIIVLANSELLESTAKSLNLPLTLSLVDWENSPQKHQPSVLKFEQVELAVQPMAGKLEVKNSLAIIKMLTRSGELGLSHQANAIVTAPVHKAVLNQVQPSFLGHTEFYAEQAGINKVVMMLSTEALRMTLATTHIPLSEVSAAITPQLLKEVILVIHNSFTQFGINQPKIAVCGINPHAGEDGLLGKEDQTVVEPAIKQLQEEGLNVHGPFPSDSLFTPSKREEYDVFLAMYHDQGLPVVKALGFGQCVNVTLGLPYIRTSVDHGTALDIASQRIASENSLEYAINYAIQLAKGQLPA